MNLELEAQDAEFEKLIECNQCGRTFGRKAYKTHVKICRKVFKKKKTPSQKEQENGKKDEFGGDKNWKQQSEALREMLKANRKGGNTKKKEGGGKGKSVKKTKQKGGDDKNNEYDKFLQDGRKECPLCKKLFSEQGLIRHTPLCQSKQNFDGGRGRFRGRQGR